MDLSGRIKTVVENVVQAAAFEPSAIGLAFPCLSWISANGGYTYDTTIRQCWCSQWQDLQTYSTLTPPSLGLDSDEKTIAITNK